MEPATEVSDNPPSYHGNISMTDSPDTLSVCSDAFSDDLEITVSSPGTFGDDNDDEGLANKAGLSKKLKKQWGGDISFEGMLMSAAAVAKKFTAERQKGMNKLKRSQSAGSPGSVTSTQGKEKDFGGENNADQHQENAGSLSRASSVADAGQHTEGVDIRETVQEEEDALLRRKISFEQSPCHSDDSESRQSGNEGGAVEEEASEK